MLTRTITMLAAAGFAIAGCSTTTGGNLPVFQSDEVPSQAQLFTPIYNDLGEHVAYEDGTVIRDLNGRRIGSRLSDLRSRQTNLGSKGVMLIMGPLDTRRVVTDAPIAPRPVSSL